MVDYLGLTNAFGIGSVWMAIVILWSLIWKLIALWKSARKGSWVWFILIGILNTFGILEILYIFIFSKMSFKKPLEKPKKIAKK